MTRVNVVNINLAQLPAASWCVARRRRHGSACGMTWRRTPRRSMHPSPSYYREYQGYTLGLLAAVLSTGGVYALGKLVLAPLVLGSLPEAERNDRLQRFNSTCLARVLLLLYLVVRTCMRGDT